MFTGLPEALRAHGLMADVRTLLLTHKSMSKGLVHTLGDLHNVLKGLVVKEPEDIGPFTKAFYDYFLSIQVEYGETLEDAILRSQVFREWKLKYNDDPDIDNEKDLATKFLDQVHLTRYDIQQIVSGREIINKNDADKEDNDTESDQDQEAKENTLDRMADYSEIELKELLERLEEIRKNQTTDHAGGDHWIGTSGISPFGHGGGANQGIRLNGTGGGRMARQVMGNPQFFPVDRDALLNDNNVDAALSSLKGVIEESSDEKLDINTTIRAGLKKGGIFLPEFKNEKEEDLKVIVMIDNGGYSMSPYIRSVQELFRKMKTRFAHDLEVFYFHNTIYNVVFTDERRRNRLTIKKLLTYDKRYRVFIIGDAAMAPYELSIDSHESLNSIASRFKKTVWLNPEPIKYWPMTYTIQAIKQIFPMYPLTPHGIERAVRNMNEKTGSN